MKWIIWDGASATQTSVSQAMSLRERLAGELRDDESRGRVKLQIVTTHDGVQVPVLAPASLLATLDEPEIVGDYERPKVTLTRLIANARAAKTYDTYHSTTLEGYRISSETVEAIVRGEPSSDGPKDETALQAAMAVQGYSRAFDEVLAFAPRHEPITRVVILDLYEALFRPSVDAGVVETHELRRWRNRTVGLHGWRHVPPNDAKVPDLMLGLEEFAARPGVDPIAHAMLVHLEFVTVHSFIDGNGRLGRLLMNSVLLANGLPWVTVRADERVPFFGSIERAQVDNDTAPFVRYLWHLIRQAMLDVGEKRSGGGRRR